ncbi:MAG TPA: isoprenylcysteine carboxylmethyltransferase family protein [Candidatus Rubrimentiphilum sp.]|nr:isoprenylcysteine carboxylmethyltransferase family protein [Candidatus Rubrimentiphilum sp.]
MSAFVFKNRGALLALPAVLLVIFGKPSALGIMVGLPIAVAGELLRCWAVGYSGVTTRNDAVIAPELVTAGPYAYVRNPLYIGNFITAVGFAIAFTGGNPAATRTALLVVALGTMIAVYATIIPHEEHFLQARFGESFIRYCREVARIIPRGKSAANPQGTWKPEVIAQAESRTFLFFGAMLILLAVKAFLV